MLKLRSIGIDDYRVLDAGQRIGRIRLATERMPPVWLWAVTIHLPGDLPTGSSPEFNTAKAEFKAAWKTLKASTPCGGLSGNEHSGRLRDARRPCGC
jgi:hypothetical protein